ncbi:MAG TPA: FlgD immunoglobulin-like domain containing protein, partial [Candidatus Krumholzibacteriaceae bacterium]|nr:FlgD immunoglobulin-like domain containing protein [Candidatus Krumholzibacteriaceae bacterium]
TPDASWGIEIEGDSAYVADGFGGVLLYNISDPTDLVYEGYYETEGEVHGVDIGENRIFVAAGEMGWDIINKKFIFASPYSGDKPERNIQDSSSIPQASAFDFINPERHILSSGDIQSFTFDIQKARDSLIVVASWDSVKVIKFKSIMSSNVPTLIDGKDTPGGAIDFDIVGNRIFISNHTAGLEIIDFDDCIDVIGSLEIPGYSYGFDIEGDYLYLANDEAGMRVIDISDEESPHIVATFDTPGYAVNVHVSGNYAYLSDWEEGVRVVDISDPTVPVLAGSSPLETTPEGALNWPWDVKITGNYALAANHSGGIKVLQVTPDYTMDFYHTQSLTVNATEEVVATVKLNTVQEGSVDWEISADGGDSWQNINPDNKWHNLVYPGNRLIWRSTHSYPGGMTTSPCSFLNIEWDSQVPALLANSPEVLLKGSAIQVEWSVSRISDEMKFIVYRGLYPDGNFQKISVVDAQDRLKYRFIDDRCEDGETYYYSVYASEDDKEIFLFDTKPITIPPAVLSLHQNRPNPFNPLTTIGYNLSVKSHVALDIYDVSGRLIKKLVDEVKEKGPHEIIWDGKDSEGHTVGSGVYFYTLKAENGKKTRKMVLLK